MTLEERAQVDAALTNSLVAKAVWQTLTVKLASKGPVTMTLVQEALYAAESKLQIDAVFEYGTTTGRISAAAREQLRGFRAQVADLNVLRPNSG